ncbi:hypothetical protein [Pseudooceanicola sp. 200-1SW]|uniref:hypothetical protein n=1 Tax=Pseudooceanicola sp. 200-1SW TaxID=3425949 RepID=UPI003D7F2D94
MAVNYEQRLEDVELNPGAVDGANAEWCKDCDQANLIFQRKAQAISAATQAGKRLQPVVREFLRHPKVRLAASLRALGGASSKEQILDLRERVNAWATDYPPIRWHARRKPDGTSRSICILPPELKAVHYMVAEVVRQQLARSESLYGVSGASRDDAARTLKQLQNDGHVYLAQTDIVDCFQSVDPDALYQLPLPQEVIRRALDPRNLTIIEEGGYRTSQVHHASSLSGAIHVTHKASGPKGLMQGSPASSIILAWLLNGLPSRESARVLLCFDNIAVAARTPEGCREMADTLIAHFERCPAGPLALCVPEFADGTAMSFLGYVFDPVRHDIGIDGNALNRLERRLVSEEAADELHVRTVVECHEAVVQDLPFLSVVNPLANEPPARVWRTLREFRAGFPAAHSDCSELNYYLETSAYVAEARGDWRIEHLHRNLFAERGTVEDRALRAILSRCPRNAMEVPK